MWLDNSRTERGPVVGRGSHFGSKSRSGTEAAAILYSLIETAKVNGVSPDEFLLEVCRRAKLSPKAVLLPWDYKRELVVDGELELQAPARSLAEARGADRRPVLAPERAHASAAMLPDSPPNALRGAARCTVKHGRGHVVSLVIGQQDDDPRLPVVEFRVAA